LDTDAAEGDLWLIVTLLFSTDLGGIMFGQIDEDLAVKHTVFVEVQDLRVATHLGFLDFALGCLCFLLMLLLLGKFLLP